jgi:predicted GIY-YIG superfamily endonuclease
VREEYLTGRAMPIDMLEHARWFYVYRLFDVEDRLLYVGMTADPYTRWAQHRGRKPWSHLVVSVRLERFAYINLALEAERVAIITEHPRFNVRSTKTGNQGVAERARAWQAQQSTGQCPSNAQAHAQADATNGRTRRTDADSPPPSVDIPHLVTRATSTIEDEVS